MSRMLKFAGAGVAAAALVALAVPAHAQYTEYTWRGSNTTDWTDVNNWQAPSGILPSGSLSSSRLSVYNNGGSPLFYTAAQGTTILAPSGGTSPRALVAGSSGTGVLYITGGSLELRGTASDVIGNTAPPGIVVVDGGTLIKTNGNEFILGLGGTGWGALLVSNGTAVIRSLSNNVSGSSVTLAGGTLQLGFFRKTGTAFTNYFNGGTLKAYQTTTSWIQSDAVNLVGGSGFTIDTLAYDADLLSSLKSNSPSGGITKTGTGILTLAAANTFAGPLVINVGRVVLRHDNALAGASGVVVSNDTYLGIGNGVTAGAGVTATLHGRYLGDNSGSLRVRDGSATWAGNVLLGASGARIGASGGAQSLTISGVIDDGANTYGPEIRTVDNASEVVFSGSNTYGGTTSVIVGGMRIAGADDRLPVGTLLEIGNGSDVGSARFDLGGFDQTVGGLASLGTSMSVAITNSGVAASTLTVNQVANRAYRGPINGNVNLVKGGAGTLTLSGNFNSTGAVQVSGGILAFTGTSAVAASTLQIDAGAKLVATNRAATLHLGALQTLKGTGTFVGGLIVDSGATVAPGASPGTLTMAGDLTMNAGATLSIEINGTTAGQFDVLALSGSLLTLNGASLDVTLGFSPTPYADSFTIVSGLGALPTGTFDGKPDGGTFTAGGSTFLIDYTDSSIVLSVIPEPSTLGVMALAAGLAFLRRRR